MYKIKTGNYRHTLTLICIVFTFLPARAQLFNLTRFTHDDGLASDYIYDLAQNEQGFLEIATGDGLTSYDGTGFTNYDTTKGLADNLISSIAVNDEGDIITGHFQNGLSRKRGRLFTKIAATKNLESPVTTIFYDKERIVFGTRVGKLGVIEKNKLTLLDVNGASFINKIIKIEKFYFIVTDNGVYTYNGVQTPQLHPATQGHNITSLCDLGDSKIIVGNDIGEIVVYTIVPGTVPILKKISSEIVCQNTTIKSIIKLKNRLIFASWGKGVFIADLNTRSYTLYNLKCIGLKNGLDNPFVNVVFMDWDEDIWIGTFGGGLYKYNNTHFRIYNKASGIAYDRVKSVFAADERILIGFENGFEVLNLDYADSSVFFNSKNKFFDDHVNSIAAFSASEYLLATENHGLILFDIKKLTFTDFFKNAHLHNFPNAINHVHVGRNANIYVSTTEGLYIYNQKNKKTGKLTTYEGLPHNNILSTFLDSKGRLWFIAPKSPPGMMENDSVTLFKDLPNFKSYNVTDVCENSDGDIFIATNGDGLYKYSKNTFSQFTVRDGLASSYLVGLEFVKKNQSVICAHQNGISVLDLKTNRIHKYTDKSVLKGYENMANAVTSHGESVYLGTLQGLQLFLMDEKIDSAAAPINSLTHITINDSAYSVHDSVIYLPYNQYDIKFEFIGVELSNPSLVNYTYQLMGLEDKAKTTNSTNVEYHKLKDGQYTFVLNSSNAAGISSKKEIRIKIVIDLPIYKKWWFILFAIATLTCLVFFIVWFRTRQLRMRTVSLERTVTQRTVAIANMNKLLEGKNADITASIDYAKRIQTVLLPRKEEILSSLNAFVYYKPRDIVSGDFYWFHKTERYCYIAAVDCTGHGVPGAFMSLIGSTFLDQIIADLREPGTSQMLEELNKKIIKSLRQKETEGAIQDGMDMALCKIDTINKKIEFSGAGRPLYFIRNGQLSDIKTAGNAIGGFYENTRKSFLSETLDYKTGDMMFIFSDGYADQFGGPKGKRFTTKQMKETLTASAHQSVDTQYATVAATFNAWKESKHQTDDVLVIGIKL